MSSTTSFPDIIVGKIYRFVYIGGEKLIYTVTDIDETSYGVSYASGISHRILLYSRVHLLSEPIDADSKDVRYQRTKPAQPYTREPRHIKSFSSSKTQLFTAPLLYI